MSTNRTVTAIAAGALLLLALAAIILHRPSPTDDPPTATPPSVPTAAEPGIADRRPPPPGEPQDDGGAPPRSAEARGDTAEPTVQPEVQLGLGSEAFVKGEMETARRHFGAIVDETPNHPMAPYAAYKLAWCEANLGDHRAAVREMQRVITWLRDEGRPEKDVSLREALMDMEHFRGQLDTGGPAAR
jgi:hypothetical protein